MKGHTWSDKSLSNICDGRYLIIYKIAKIKCYSLCEKYICLSCLISIYHVIDVTLCFVMKITIICKLRLTAAFIFGNLNFISGYFFPILYVHNYGL